MSACRSGDAALAAVVARVEVLRGGYEPPDFAHVPGPDAAIFLCAVDHKTGYERRAHGRRPRPFRGQRADVGGRAAGSARPAPSAHGGPAHRDRAARRWLRPSRSVARPSPTLSAAPACGATLPRAWSADYAGRGGAATRLASSDGRLGGAEGCWRGSLRSTLTPIRSQRSPSYSRRSASAAAGSTVADPERWQVSADNVLMRLALQVGPGRAGRSGRGPRATRDAFRRGRRRGWGSRRRTSTTCCGSSAGTIRTCSAPPPAILREPPRDPDSSWY